MYVFYCDCVKCVVRFCDQDFSLSSEDFIDGIYVVALAPTINLCVG